MNKKEVVIIAAAVAVLLKPAFSAGSSQVETGHYDSSGRSVAVEIVQPTRPGRHPAILLLHGRSGLSLYRMRFNQLGLRLAGQGFTVFIPHYFDASASPDSPDVTPALFETWRKALKDALIFAGNFPQIDQTRLGVVGVSLGGFLAGVEAVQDDRVAALVSESAGVSTWFPSNPRRMPPLLIVHARQDGTVPLSSALQLAEIAKSLGVQPELALYDGRQHLLVGRSARSAEDRMVAFLVATLGPTYR